MTQKYGGIIWEVKIKIKIEFVTAQASGNLGSQNNVSI